MTLVGYCEKCRLIKLVHVWTLVTRRNILAYGICEGCEQRGRDEAVARYRARLAETSSRERGLADQRLDRAGNDERANRLDDEDGLCASTNVGSNS